MPWPVGAVICLVGPGLIHKRLKVARRKRLIRQLPDTLDSLVGGGLRSGMSLPQALGLLAEELPKPSSQEFSLVVRKLRMDVGLDDAPQCWPTAPPTFAIPNKET